MKDKDSCFTLSVAHQLAYDKPLSDLSDLGLQLISLYSERLRIGQYDEKICVEITKEVVFMNANI